MILLVLKDPPGDAAGGAIGPSNNNQTQVAAMVVKGQSVVSAKDNPNNKVKKITIAAKYILIHHHR